MFDLLDVNWQVQPAGYDCVSTRDADILSIIEEENLTLFTFDGLKRRTGLHPETLSRILVRLEDEGIIKKGKEGYTVTPKLTRLKLNQTHSEEHTATLLQTFLPSDVMTSHLISELKGRWFGLLRWLGVSENNQGITLKWLTEDGGMQIAANIQGTALNIEAKFIRSSNLNLALKSAYQLMANIGKYSQVSRATAKNVSYYGYSDFSLPS
jgi:hypothetical protein